VRTPALRSKSFELHVTYTEDRARITATGCLDISAIPELRRMVMAAAVLPISGVTVDLAGVDALDRDVVIALVTLRSKVRDQRTAFALGSISEPVRRALDLASVGDLFDQESLWSGYPSPDGQT
jgi:anti-anti-sigma factor